MVWQKGESVVFTQWRSKMLYIFYIHSKLCHAFHIHAEAALSRWYFSIDNWQAFLLFRLLSIAYRAMQLQKRWWISVWNETKYQRSRPLTHQLVLELPTTKQSPHFSVKAFVQIENERVVQIKLCFRHQFGQFITEATEIFPWNKVECALIYWGNFYYKWRLAMGVIPHKIEERQNSFIMQFHRQIIIFT